MNMFTECLDNGTIDNIIRMILDSNLNCSRREFLEVQTIKKGMQNPEIQLCNSKMKCAAKTSYARNYDHPECSTRTKYNTTTYYIQKRAFINGVLDSESIGERSGHVCLV